MTDLIPVTRLISLTALQCRERESRAKPTATVRLKTNSTLHPALRRSFDALTSASRRVKVCPRMITAGQHGQPVSTSSCDEASQRS